MFIGDELIGRSRRSIAWSAGLPSCIFAEGEATRWSRRWGCPAIDGNSRFALECATSRELMIPRLTPPKGAAVQ